MAPEASWLIKLSLPSVWLQNCSAHAPSFLLVYESKPVNVIKHVSLYKAYVF